MYASVSLCECRRVSVYIFISVCEHVSAFVLCVCICVFVSESVCLSTGFYNMYTCSCVNSYFSGWCLCLVSVSMCMCL